MNRIRVQPVEIIGTCPAGLSSADEFEIDGMNLIPASGGKLCFLAFGHLPPGTWQLQSGSRFFAHVSCPGCTTELEHENRVIFLLGHADKWELCRVISAYRRQLRERDEPEAALRLRQEAMQAQSAGDFGRALEKMKLALNASLNWKDGR